MKQARVKDDGTIIELDVHGVYVDEAIALVRKAAELAAERGRSTLRIIHGSSTSFESTHNRTIKHEVQIALHEGITGVASHFSIDDVTLLNLSGSQRRDPTPLSLFDLR